MFIKKVCFVLLQIAVVSALNFNIDFQNPMTLSSSINFIKTTPNGRIIIHFKNADWHVYNSSFSLITSFQILNQTWSDLQIFSDSFAGILNQARDFACFFNLSLYTASTCNNMSGIIGIQPLNAILNYLAVANSTKFMAYSSLGPMTFSNISPLVSFTFIDYSLGVGTVTNGSVYKMKYTFLNYNYSLIYSHSSIIKYLKIIDKQIVFTQDSVNSIKAYNLTSNTSLGVASNLFDSLILIQKISTNLLFIYSLKILYVSFNSTSLEYQKIGQVIFNASISNLVVVTTSIASLAYVPSSNILYSVSQCNNNSVFNGTDCTPYSCNDIYCISCPISSNICSKCQSNYVINTSFGCDLSVNFSNISNSSNSSLNLNSSSFSNFSNTSSFLNSSNFSDLSNSSNSSNVLNSSDSFNSSTSNNSSNSTTYNNYSQQNATNSSNLTITILNQNQKICSILLQLNNQGNCVAKENYKTFKQILDFGKVFNGISSVRVLFQFLSPLYSFYDDYWYYIYHLFPSNNSFSYLYLVQLYDMNNQRIVPNFKQIDYIQSLTSFSTYKNTSKFDVYCPERILNFQNQNIYFLQILLPMVAQNWFISILIFIICKLLFKLFRSILSSTSEKSIIFKVVRLFTKYFEGVSLKGMIIIAIFQPNLIILSFRGTAQLFNSFSFDFTDKINLILLNFIFCLFIVYALCFYFLITSCNKDKYENYLNEKKNINNSFTVQFYLLGMKNLTAGVIHFLFLQTLTVFYFLILLKIWLIFICLKYRSCYKSKISNWLVILYYLLGLVFDLFLIWSQPMISSGQDVSDQFYPQIIQKGCLFGFIVALFLKIVYDLLYQLKQTFCLSKNKLQISNQCKNQKQTYQKNKIVPFQKSQIQQFFGDALLNFSIQYRKPVTKKKTVEKDIKQTNHVILKQSPNFVIKMDKAKKKQNKHRLKFTIINQANKSQDFLNDEIENKKISAIITEKQDSKQESNKPIQSFRKQNSNLKTQKVRRMRLNVNQKKNVKEAQEHFE